MLLITAFLIAFSSANGDLQACLPPDIKLTDVVAVRSIERKPGVIETVKTTVADKLKALGARCRKGKLRDATGKEIYFYRMVGCWGNPPADYQEILDRQTHELTELKKRYRVIEMTCNPGGEKDIH